MNFALFDDPFVRPITRLLDLNKSSESTPDFGGGCVLSIIGFRIVLASYSIQ